MSNDILKKSLEEKFAKVRKTPEGVVLNAFYNRKTKEKKNKSSAYQIRLEFDITNPEHKAFLDLIQELNPAIGTTHGKNPKVVSDPNKFHLQLRSDNKPRIFNEEGTGLMDADLIPKGVMPEKSKAIAYFTPQVIVDKEGDPIGSLRLKAIQFTTFEEFTGEGGEEILDESDLDAKALELLKEING
jgi:hypothetical protein